MPQARLQPSLSFLLAVTIGFAGGAVFWYLRAPLPWMLGSMAACAIAAMLRMPVAMPAFVRAPMMSVLGTMLGASFGGISLAQIAGLGTSIAVMLVFLLVATVANYLFFRRLAGFDHTTAYFSAMPGGLIEMLALGAAKGGDERLISLVHAARIFVVVISVPFILQFMAGREFAAANRTFAPLGAVNLNDALWFFATLFAGMALARITRLPAGFLLAPLIVSAVLHVTGVTDFVVPTVLVGLAQLVLGCAVGCRFAGASAGEFGRPLSMAVAAAAILLLMTFAFAELASLLTGESLVTMVLTYSPGGLAEMSLIAFSLSGDIVFVITHHLIRLVIVVIAASALYRS